MCAYNYQSPDVSFISYDLQTDACIFVFIVLFWYYTKKMNKIKNIFSPETASDYISTRDKIEDKKKASGNKLTTSGNDTLIICKRM